MKTKQVTLPFGSMELAARDGKLISAKFIENCGIESQPEDGARASGVDELTADEAILQYAGHELVMYATGALSMFTVPCFFKGTDFQNAVWTALLGIPYGQTISYSELARMIGHPRAMRAVGTAVGHNPLPVIIPCHRVVGVSSLGGYHYGLEVKKTLLDLEAHTVRAGMVRS